MILVVDNYDSFTFNLVQALQAAGADVRVIRNDAIDRAGVEALADDPEAELRGIVISPGPGDPDDAGVSVDTVPYYYVFGLFKIGVVLQQIYHRYHVGQTKDARFANFDQVAEMLFAVAQSRSDPLTL